MEPPKSCGTLLVEPEYGVIGTMQVHYSTPPGSRRFEWVSGRAKDVKRNATLGRDWSQLDVSGFFSSAKGEKPKSLFDDCGSVLL
jgi:hypothetical protein